MSVTYFYNLAFYSHSSTGISLSSMIILWCFIIGGGISSILACKVYLVFSTLFLDSILLWICIAFCLSSSSDGKSLIYWDFLPFLPLGASFGYSWSSLFIHNLVLYFISIGMKSFGPILPKSVEDKSNILSFKDSIMPYHLLILI